jgi:CAAX protease family protein
VSSDFILDLPAPGRDTGALRARLLAPVRRHPLVTFFVVAYGLSWSTAIVHLITGSGPPLVSCGPALAAILVLSLTVGRSGVSALFRSMVQWRVGARWWAVALLAPVVLTGAAAGLNLALGAPTPSGDELSAWTNVLPVALFILLVPVFGGAWEEPGWRGFALPRLLGDRSPLVASLVLGVLWAGWHVPLLLTGGQHWSDLILVVLGTVVFTWLFQSAGASLLVAMVFHALNNAVSGEYVSQWFDGADSTRQSWLLVLVWGVAAACVVRRSSVFRAAPA